MVTTAVLYASSTWALTQLQERDLTTARRRMLRYVFQVHRGSDEDWVPFVQRAAQRVDSLAANYQMEDWIQLYRKRKWKFAGRLARKTDDRWSRLTATWRPNDGHGRDRGAPCTRWSDQLETFAGGDWMTEAMDSDRWISSEEVFANWDFARKRH